ncbi:MAG: bifunctional adenosylcobinamide kinase/adenosylcobinamide-phosphate guanylyltransferase [Mycobacteriaceae bacterium]
MRTLVLGGIRSGKSRYAESLLSATTLDSESIRYIATAARPLNSDPEWLARIATHQKSRPPWWSTVETADLIGTLQEEPHATAIIDDLGMWLTRQFDELCAWESVTTSVSKRCQDLVAAVTNYQGTLILVSPEVGLTIVPATRSGRQFADELGLLNSAIAQVCEHVVLVVAGLPMNLK